MTKIHSILQVFSITKPTSRKCWEKEVWEFWKRSRFLGKVFARKYFLTIQKDQLDHTARTGNRCRMGAKLAQRGLKTALFVCSVLHLNHLVRCPSTQIISLCKFESFESCNLFITIINSFTVPINDVSQMAS